MNKLVQAIQDLIIGLIVAQLAISFSGFIFIYFFIPQFWMKLGMSLGLPISKNFIEHFVYFAYTKIYNVQCNSPCHKKPALAG